MQYRYRQCQTLSLDKNGKMIKMIPWQQAIVKAANGKSDILMEYDQVIGHSDKPILKPKVIIQRTFDIDKIDTSVHNKRMSNQMLLQRDGYKCQYCSTPLTLQTMTRDHVDPKRLGGKAEPTNCVAACHDCNQKKAGKLYDQADMPLINGWPKDIPPFMVTKKMREVYQEFKSADISLLQVPLQVRN